MSLNTIKGVIQGTIYRVPFIGLLKGSTRCLDYSFPKIRGTFWGAPILGNFALGCPHWGPSYLWKYYIWTQGVWPHIYSLASGFCIWGCGVRGSRI